MGCTTILVGRGATNDGSVIVARNDDAQSGTFDAKRMLVVKPADQPRRYTSRIGHLTIKLPDKPLRYTCVPNVDPAQGIWGEDGINSANVCMSATETISSNPRVLGADPLVTYRPQSGAKGKPGYVPEQPGGIGEEDLLTIVLPYIKSAREGVLRMGSLLEKHGTYEMNGVAFGDEEEVWYLETIGGHHWIARRVPDGCYVAQPNMQGIDYFDLTDALGEQKEFMCSPDLAEWMEANRLFAGLEDPCSASACGEGAAPTAGFLRHLHDDAEAGAQTHVFFNARAAFGSATWHDIIYNTPRKWSIVSQLNPGLPEFEGPAPKWGPQSFDIPWAMVPERKVSVADVKALLSGTYEGTEFNCYGAEGTLETRHRYRPIGINRTSECSILAIRPYAPHAARGVQWLSLASSRFNASIALYTNVDRLPACLETGMNVTTDSLYWENRMIAALADPEFLENYGDLLAYQEDAMAQGYASLRETDMLVEKAGKRSGRAVSAMLEEANDRLATSIKAQTDDLLAKVLYTRSMHMENAFNSNDH